MTENPLSIEEIFGLALDISDAAERNRFIQKTCGQNHALLSEVKLLLESHENLPERFLENQPELPVEAAAEIEIAPQFAETIAPSETKIMHFMADRLPRQFGNYELLEKIAQGGMGVVYKARQTKLNRLVALKMILSGQLAGSGEVERFQLEAESAACMDHPGIVPIYESGCIGGQHFIAMGFVDGPSLATRISESTMPPRDAAKYLIKIAEAVQAAHECGIVHRDLKPANVLLDSNGQPRVTDFGLAKKVDTGSDLTATGMILGTPSYMPPEQASGDLKKITSSADIYSLGGILYAMLCGRAPFEAGSQAEVIMQVIKEEPRPLRQMNAKIPKDLETICLKCLEKNPKHRYESAQQLVDDLKLYLAGDPICAKSDWYRRFRKWMIREPVLAAHLAATAVLMTGIMLSYLLWRDLESVAGESYRVMVTNLSILTVWAITTFVLQKAQNRFQTENAIPILWSALNPIFLTCLIAANLTPRAALFSGYILLMIYSCFFRRVDLVLVTSFISFVGYILLIIFTFQQETLATADCPGTPRSYLVAIGVTILAAGGMLYFLTSRLQRLSQSDN